MSVHQIDQGTSAAFFFSSEIKYDCSLIWHNAQVQMIGTICFELTEFNYICQFNAYMYVCLRDYEMWSVESSEPQSRTENISIN